MPFSVSKKQLHIFISLLFIISAYAWQSNQSTTKTTSPTPVNATTSQSQVANDSIADLDQTESVSNLDLATEPASINSDPATISEFYPVIRVIDGDTLEINYEDKPTKVRLIGVNTPETVDPRRKVECFGREASNYAKATLSKQSVRLEFDPSQGERDKYQRLLAYLYLSDGTLFNLTLIKDGYAYEYTYKTPYLHQARFQTAQALAQDQQLGLWSETNCPAR